jgi:hypothetical protein
MPCRLDDTKNTADFRSVRTDACAMTSLFHEEMLQTTTYIQLQDAQPLFDVQRTAANSSVWLDKIKNDIFLHVMILSVR